MKSLNFKKSNGRKLLTSRFRKVLVCIVFLSLVVGGFLSCSQGQKGKIPVFESYYEKLRGFSSMQLSVAGASTDTGYTTTDGDNVPIESVEFATGCSAATLNPTGVVIASALEWKIFVTCVLKNWNFRKPLANGATYRAYPPIAASNQKDSAYDFLVDALANLRANYDIDDVSIAEGFAIYEGFLLLTRFTMVSSVEEFTPTYNNFVNRVSKRGLVSVLEQHLNDWHVSDFYTRHFDYSKSPGGRYRMARLWGMLNDRNGRPLEGATVEIINSNVQGHVLKTTTTSLQNRVKRLRMLLDEDAALYASAANKTNIFKHNFGLQFYMPLDQFTRNKKGKITDNTISPDPTLTLRISKEGHEPLTQKVSVKHRFTHPDFPYARWRNDIVLTLPKVEIFVNLNPDISYTYINSMTIEGGVINFDSATTLNYSLNGASASARLNRNNRFTFSLQLPETRDLTSYTLTITVANNTGTSYQTKNIITYVPEIVPDQLVLTFNQDTEKKERDRVLKILEGEVILFIFAGNMVTVALDLPPGSNVLAKQKVAEKFLSVRFASPDFYVIPLQSVPPQEIPDDLRFSSQWGLNNTGQGYDVSGSRLRGTSDADIDAPEAWKITTGNENTIIAIADSGIDWRHPDLVANIWQNAGEDLDNDGHTIACVVAGVDTGISTAQQCVNGRWEFDPGDIVSGDKDYNMEEHERCRMNSFCKTGDDDCNCYVNDFIGWDFVDNDNDPKPNNSASAHGTHVAGIAGASGGNLLGVAGVNWKAKIMPLKAAGHTSTMLKGMEYAVQQNADVANYSYGGRLSIEEFEGYDNVVKATNQSSSTLHVIAAGSNQINLAEFRVGSSYLLFPTQMNIANKMVVAATYHNDKIINKSNEYASGRHWGFGSDYSSMEVDIAAPGGHILSTVPFSDDHDDTNDYGYMSGTSMAAPHVSGVAALVLARYPGLKGEPLLVKEQILRTADISSTLLSSSNCPDTNNQPADCVVNGRRLNAYNAVRQTPENLPLFVQDMSTGYLHACTIIRGAAYCSGANGYGQLGDGTTTRQQVPVAVLGLASNVTAIEPGMHHTCAIHNGAVKCWGRNYYGQLGDDTTINQREPVAVIGLTSGVTDLSAGAHHNCVIQNGAAKCWGSNIRSQVPGASIVRVSGILGAEENEVNRLKPTQVIGLTSGVEQISAGDYRSCVVHNGAVKCWGRYHHSFSGTGYGSLTPTVISSLSANIKQVSVSKKYSHTCAVAKDDTVKCFEEDDVPSAIAGLGSDVTDISAGNGYACAIQNRVAKCWGSNSRGQLGDGTTVDSLTTAVRVDGLTNNLINISAGGGYTCATTNGNVYCWGNGGLRQLVDGFVSEIVTGNIVTKKDHSCAIVSGAAKCWGYNFNGQLGNGKTYNSSTPVQVNGLSSHVTAISTGSTHTCAIHNGAAKCWGDNADGQLGDGSGDESSNVESSSVPVGVLGLTSGVTAISAGLMHTCAIVNGAAQCWGNNLYGQLGDGNGGNSISLSRVPSGVTGLSLGVTSISAGDYHTCSITSDGVKCWGSNAAGMTGDALGSRSSRNLVPVSVDLGAGVISAISAGGAHTCAIVNGAAKCWGYNARGQLGNRFAFFSVIEASAGPINVMGLSSGVTSISAGNSHTCAIHNRVLKCWGENSHDGGSFSAGRLGIGPIMGSDIRVPTPVIFLPNGVSSVSAGANHTCAVANGRAYCWGNNTSGELGIGSTLNTTRPTSPIIFPTSGVSGQNEQPIRIILEN